MQTRQSDARELSSGFDQASETNPMGLSIERIGAAIGAQVAGSRKQVGRWHGAETLRGAGWSAANW
ncbi:MAG: hypothetical protein GVY22_19325 [Gammaproteobacteria bacterium]|jgi:hypothetical protein|nr:hypothetical protein [Gammaproteobacteria bacterium]